MSQKLHLGCRRADQAEAGDVDDVEEEKGPLAAAVFQDDSGQDAAGYGPEREQGSEPRDIGVVHAQAFVWTVRGGPELWYDDSREPDGHAPSPCR